MSCTKFHSAVSVCSVIFCLQVVTVRTGRSLDPAKTVSFPCLLAEIPDSQIAWGIIVLLYRSMASQVNSFGMFPYLSFNYRLVICDGDR